MENREARLASWLERSKAIVAATPLAPFVEETGRVEAVSDGIALGE